MQEHPLHVVAAWIGNTPKIALGHYLQTLEADFEKAVLGVARSGAKSGAVEVQNPVRTESDGKPPETTNAAEPRENEGFRRVVSNPVAYCTIEQLAKVGLEPTNLSVLDFESSAYAIPPHGFYRLFRTPFGEGQ